MSLAVSKPLVARHPADSLAAGISESLIVSERLLPLPPHPVLATSNTASETFNAFVSVLTMLCVFGCMRVV